MKEPKFDDRSFVENASTFKEVTDAIKSEREYQLRRWGFRQPDGSSSPFLEATHTPVEFLLFMQHYMTEAIKAATTLPYTDHTYIDMMRKVVTLGVAAFEQHGITVRDLNQPIVNGRDGQPA